MVLYLAGRGFRDRRYFQQFRQRLGFLPREFRQPAPGAIWLHAVSVGEVLSSLELLQRLRAEFPLAPLFVSSTTLAGKATAKPRAVPQAIPAATVRGQTGNARTEPAA